jgi:pyruvate dehydrogenase E2 component (dihydrolipoamide acetyltransferase)
MAIERLLTGSIKDQIKDLMSTEDLVIEAFRDLVKDELKTHIRNKVEDDPELKAEIKEAPEETEPAARTAETKTSVPESKAEETPITVSESEQTGFIKASPIAKRLAREHGIDLSSIKGSGPNGRIVEKDVLAALSSSKVTKSAKATIKKLSPMRKTIADNLSKMYRETVLVTNMTEVDMSNLFAFKKSLEKKVSVTAILVKVVADVLKALPKFNVNFDGETITEFSNVNIGVAVNTESGLVVPVIKNVDTLSLTEINDEIKRLSLLAREGNLTADDLQGSHFTLTNLGMMRTEMFTPVLNKNEVAILGVGRTVKKVVVLEDEKFAVRDMAYFSLSYDHRVIDGADAANFLGKLADIIESSPFVI